MKGCCLSIAPLVYELNINDCEHISWHVFPYTLCPRMYIYLILNLYCVFISQPLDIHSNVICTWQLYCCPVLLTFSVCLPHVCPAF